MGERLAERVEMGADGEGEGEKEGSALALAMDAEAAGLAVPVLCPGAVLGEGEAESCAALSDGDAEFDCVGASADADGEGVADSEAVSLREIVGLGDAETHAVALTVADDWVDGVCDTDGVRLDDGEARAVADRLGDGALLEEALGERESEPEAQAEKEGCETEGDAVLPALALACADVDSVAEAATLCEGDCDDPAESVGARVVETD